MEVSAAVAAVKVDMLVVGKMAVAAGEAAAEVVRRVAEKQEEADGREAGAVVADMVAAVVSVALVACVVMEVGAAKGGCTASRS